MQAVILAAGRGTRMGSLTDTLPKPMLPVGDKTLLEHKFDAFPDEITEIVIIIGYLGDAIRAKFGDSYKGKKMTYVKQANIVGGTADALWQARNVLTGKFLVVNGDDIYDPADFRAMLAYDWAMLIQHVPDTHGGGKVLLNPDGTTAAIVESSHHDGSAGALNTSTFMLDTRIFNYPLVPKAPGSSEMGLPQTIMAASQASGIPLHAVEATEWIQITEPGDLARAEAILTRSH